MSIPILVHDTRTKKRSPFLRSGRPEAIPVPPSLVNSPYLSSPNSVFRQRSCVPRWPSQGEDEWLRDMIPIDRCPLSDADTRSDASSTPSPTSTSMDNPFGFLLAPPSPLLRPRSVGPDSPTPSKRALGGMPSGQPSHN